MKTQPDLLLDAVTRIEVLLQHQTQLLTEIKAALTTRNMPKSYRMADTDSGVSEWLKSR